MGYLKERMKRIRSQLKEDLELSYEPKGTRIEVFPFVMDIVVDDRSNLNIQVSWVNKRIPLHFKDNPHVRPIIEPLLAGAIQGALLSIKENMSYAEYSELKFVQYVRDIINGILYGLRGKVKEFDEFLNISQSIHNAFPSEGVIHYHVSWDDTYKQLGV